MKHLIYLLVPAIMLASCGGNEEGSKADRLTKLKKQRGDIDMKIKELEAGKKDSAKSTNVSVTEVATVDFTAYVEVQSAIGGDEVVIAAARQGGTVQKITAHVGQKVHGGQVLAILDGNVLDQQINALEPQLELQKNLYEKQQKLWAQNIGTEVQLMSAKAQYEATQKQKVALQAQRVLFNIVSPISGTIDEVSIKVGDMASAGSPAFRVVNLNQLKAEANLGENYLGLVHPGDPVTLVFSNGDSIKTKLTYVAESVNPSSRSFLVQVKLGYNSKLHPNMSCVMKIANYEHKNTITVPVSIIQKTASGEMLYVASGDKAKSVQVKTGRVSNGQVEILSGLNAGDKIITVGFEDLNDGDQISVSK